jgi:hypothetical protein
VPTDRAYHEPTCPDATDYDRYLWAQDKSRPSGEVVAVNQWQVEPLTRIEAKVTKVRRRGQ